MSSSISLGRIGNSFQLDEHGPLDLIGDVHGCCDELEILLGQLGYEEVEVHSGQGFSGGLPYRHLAGRKAVFLGDLVDRGPRILDTLRLVWNMVADGSGYCVVGNHDDKFLRKLRGRNVQIKHGLENTLEELTQLPEPVRQEFEQQLESFLAALPSHYIFDDRKLVVAHAGLKETLHGHLDAKTRNFALYGDTTGQQDEYGLPIRGDWAAQYTGQPLVVYGHTPVPEPRWLNNTVNIDTGCVFGGKLTALRYPERETVSVPAAREYRASIKPFLAV